MGIITLADLRTRVHLSADLYKITQPTETGDCGSLGGFGIHALQPLDRMSFAGQLSPESHLHTLPFSSKDIGFDGIAIVFHPFTRSKYQASPSRYIVGWTTRLDNATRWVSDGNRRIQAHLSA